MTGSTPIYGLPYPTGTDRLDAAVTTIPQGLANAVESSLAGFGGIAAPGAWTVPALTAPFTNLGSTYRTTRYRKVGNLVTVEGVIRTPSATGANSVAFVLPVGFRPLQDYICMNWYGTGATNTLARIEYKTNGAVLIAPALLANDGVSLEFTFPID